MLTAGVKPKPLCDSLALKGCGRAYGVFSLEEGEEPGPSSGALLPKPTAREEIQQEVGMKRFGESMFCFRALEAAAVGLVPSGEPHRYWHCLSTSCLQRKIFFLPLVLGAYVTCYNRW